MPKQEEVSLWLKLKDGVTKAFKGMSSSFKKNMDAMRKSALVFAGAFAGVVVGVMSAVSAFKEQQRVVDQTNRVLESTAFAAGLTAKEINTMARELQKTTGVSDEVTQSAQNILLTFTNLKKDIFPGVTKVALDMTAALNGGVITQESLRMQAIQLGKALNDPRDGLSALRRVGVSFDEQQKEQIKTMQAAGDVAGAQAIMLAELQKEFGGSSENLNTLVGAQRASEAAFGDMMEIIGAAFLPIMTSVAKMIKDVSEAMQEWLPSIKDLIVPVTIFVGTLTGLLAVGGAIVVLGPVVGAAFTAMTGPIGIAVIAISGITAALLYFKNSSSEVAIKVRAIWKTLSEIIAKYAEAISLSVKFRFGEARQAYKELLQLVANSKTVFGENVKAEKDALAKSRENKAEDKVLQKEAETEWKKSQLTETQEFLDRKAEMEQIAEEADIEFKNQKKEFEKMSAADRLALLKKTLGAEKIAKTAAQIDELISKSKHEEAKKKQDELYRAAFVKLNQDTIKQLGDGWKKHWSFLLAGEKLNAKDRQALDDVVTESFKNAMTLLGKESIGAFRLMQAASIGQTIMKTYESAQNAFAALSAIPIVGPVLGGIAAAGAVTAGLMRVEQIRRQKPPQAQTGGHVERGGAAIIHEGEDIITKRQREDIADTSGTQIIELQLDRETVQRWIIYMDEEAEQMERAGLR